VTAEPSFRLAAESDTAALLKFMAAYYAFDGHGFDEQKARVALTTLLRDPDLGCVWLIRDGEVPVGYVVICFSYSLEWLGRDAFVDEFYLLPEYRGRGWVVRQNAAALQVYRKLGFKDRESTFLSKWIAQDFAKPQGQSGH
jgi:GNAT superfamily N-acetyltransferase